MGTRYEAANYCSPQHYRALLLAHDMGVEACRDYYELPRQAYDARKLDVQYQLAFAGDLIEQIRESRPGDQGWVYRAEALHVVSVPLVARVEPQVLFDLFPPALDQIIRRRREFPELHRYAGLLLRTISLAVSKLDRYTTAFQFINRAHRQLATAPAGGSGIYNAEVIQQIYLQECGQLSRNVEAALLEQDRETTRCNLNGRLPARAMDRVTELRPLRVAARSAAEAGRRAMSYLNAVTQREGLPARVDPEQRRLSVSSWFVTCAIMYMRACLLAGLVEMCAGADPSRWLLRVPDLWAAVVEKNPNMGAYAEAGLELTHRMDLTRNALLWAFLNNGDLPYTPPRYARIRSGVSDYLYCPGRQGLDTRRCADEIRKSKHNAGILDNLAHVDTYRLLADRSGSGSQGYDEWLSYRHARLRTVVDVNDANPAEIRTVGSPTLKHLHSSVRMVLLCHRYDNVLRDL